MKGIVGAAMAKQRDKYTLASGESFLVKECGWDQVTPVQSALKR